MRVTRNQQPLVNQAYDDFKPTAWMRSRICTQKIGGVPQVDASSDCLPGILSEALFIAFPNCVQIALLIQIGPQMQAMALRHMALDTSR